MIATQSSRHWCNRANVVICGTAWCGLCSFLEYSDSSSYSSRGHLWYSVSVLTCISKHFPNLSALRLGDHVASLLYCRSVLACTFAANQCVACPRVLAVAVCKSLVRCACFCHEQIPQWKRSPRTSSTRSQSYVTSSASSFLSAAFALTLSSLVRCQDGCDSWSQAASLPLKCPWMVPCFGLSVRACTCRCSHCLPTHVFHLFFACSSHSQCAGLSRRLSHFAWHGIAGGSQVASCILSHTSQTMHATHTMCSCHCAKEF